MKPTYFTGGIDIVVVDYNPEYADYSNPRGELYGFAPYVCACDDQGNTRMFYLDTVRDESDGYAKAEYLANALTARLENLGRLPIGFDSWVEGRPIYGSVAYQQYGAAEDIAWERKQN